MAGGVSTWMLHAIMLVCTAILRVYRQAGCMDAVHSVAHGLQPCLEKQ